MKTSCWKKIARRVCLTTILFITMIAGVQAQSPATSFRGQVTDPSGAGVAGATVLATSDTGDSKGATTNNEGFYEIANLAAGKYKIDVSAPGFALFTKTDIEVAGGEAAKVSAALTIQAQQEKVL